MVAPTLFVAVALAQAPNAPTDCTVADGAQHIGRLAKYQESRGDVDAAGETLLSARRLQPSTMVDGKAVPVKMTVTVNFTRSR